MERQAVRQPGVASGQRQAWAVPACAGLALALLLAACTAGPVPKLNPQLPAAWRHADAAIPAPGAPDLRGWWLGFDDPALNALVDEALRENLAVREAVERLLAARLLRLHAIDSYLPYLRAHTEDVVNPSASASYLVSSFDASWEMGLFGRIQGTRRSTQGELDEVTAQYALAKVSLVGEVVGDYLLLGAAHERLARLVQLRTLQEEQLSLLQTRQRLGLASLQLVAEAEASLARARAAEAGGRQQVDAMATQLAVLLGKPAPDADWLDRGQLAQLKAAAPVSAPADLLRNRPEIRRAEAGVLAAAGARDLAHADRLPNFGIGGSIRWSTEFLRNIRRGSTFSIVSVGPEFDLPLFDWGLRRARAEANDHLLNAAVFAYREAVVRGIGEVETALGNLQLAGERTTQAQVAADALRRGAEASAQRTALQLGNPLEALASRVAETDAQLALIDARTEHSMAYVALYKALGGAPLPDPPTVTAP